MIFKVNSKHLNQALQTCAKAISANGLMPATANYRITESDVSACNLEISITAPIKAVGDGMWDVILPADKLKPYIASLEEQELIFEIGSDYLVKITGDNGCCEMQGDTGKDFPEIKIAKGNTIELHLSELSEAFARTKYSWMNENTENSLNGLNMILDQDGILLATYNGWNSFAKFAMAGSFAQGNLILPKTFVNSVDGEGVCKFIYSDKSVSLESKGVVIKSILMAGSFVDWRPKLKAPALAATFIKSELVGAIKRVLIMSTQVLKEITISVSGGFITIVSEDKSLRNKAQETVKCSPTSKELQFSINGNLVLEAISRIPANTIGIYMESNNSPVVFKDIQEVEALAMLLPNKPM